MMITDKIEGVISTDSNKVLLLQKEEFTWTGPKDSRPLHGGPTIFKLLVTAVNPNKSWSHQLQNQNQRSLNE